MELKGEFYLRSSGGKTHHSKKRANVALPAGCVKRLAA